MIAIAYTLLQQMLNAMQLDSSCENYFKDRKYLTSTVMTLYIITTIVSFLPNAMYNVLLHVYILHNSLKN